MEYCQFHKGKRELIHDFIVNDRGVRFSQILPVYRKKIKNVTDLIDSEYQHTYKKTVDGILDFVKEKWKDTNRHGKRLHV